MATTGCLSLTAAPAPRQPLGQMLTSTRPREDPPLSAQPPRKAPKTPGEGERTSFFMKPKESRAPPLGSASQASAATGAAEQSGAPQSGPTHSSCWLPACELNCASRYATPHRVSGRFGTVVVPAPPQAPHLLPPSAAAGTLHFRCVLCADCSACCGLVCLRARRRAVTIVRAWQCAVRW